MKKENFEKEKSDRHVQVREYECLFCDKRTHIIYDGRCYGCERDRRILGE